MNWIKVSWHEPDDEELEYYGTEVQHILDCTMPDGGDEILVTLKNGNVEKVVCVLDDGYTTEEGYEWIDDIVAWMPLPKPWGEGRGKEKRDERL